MATKTAKAKVKSAVRLSGRRIGGGAEDDAVSSMNSDGHAALEVGFQFFKLSRQGMHERRIEGSLKVIKPTPNQFLSFNPKFLSEQP